MGAPKDRSNTTVIGDLAPQRDAELTADTTTIAEDDLATAISELGGSGAGWVRCYKWAKSQSGNEEGWHRCYKAPIEGFDPDRVAERWGPGKYRFQITDENNRVVKVISLTFAAPAAAGPLSAPYPTGSGAGAAPSMSADILALYQGQQKFLESMVLALMTKGAGGSGGPTTSDVLEALRLGKEMAGGGPEAAGLFQNVRDAVGLARELATGSSGEPPDLLSSLGPPVLNLIEKLISGGGAARTARPAVAPGTQPTAARPRIVPLPNARPRPVAPAPTSEAPAPVAAAPELESDLTVFARTYAPILLTEAEADRDPEVWGTWIAERLPPAYARPLLEVCKLDSDKRIDILASVAPELRAYQEWIDEAAAAIVDYLEGEPDHAEAGAVHNADPAGARGTGNQSDGRDHPAADQAASGSPSGEVLRSTA